MPSVNPSGVSGGEPKWSTSWRRFPGSSVSWSATGGSHSSTPRPTPHATLRSVDRRTRVARPTGTPRCAGDGQHDHADAEGEVRNVGLRAVRGGHDEHHDHDVVTAEDRPRRQQHEDPRQQRQVRVPRLGQRQLPVSARLTRASSAAITATPRQPSRRHPIHSDAAIAARWTTTVAASIAHDDEPSARYVGANR